MTTAEGRVQVSVDGARCVGSATCTTVAPEQFLLDEHDRSHPTEQVPIDVEAVELAEQLCPTGAIHLARIPAATDPPDLAR